MFLFLTESARASSVPPVRPFSRARSSSPFLDRLRASSVEPGLDSHFSKSDSDTPLAPRRLRASSLDRVGSLELDLLFSKYDRLLDYRSHSPTPVKPGRWAPREPEVAYDSDGNFAKKNYFFDFGFWKVSFIFYVRLKFRGMALMPE